MTIINQFYRLRCVTNLHVGSGETNYGVIDKLIERDNTSGFPCINSSGLKGAIKQKFNLQDSQLLIEVFGSDSTKNKQNQSEEEADRKNKNKRIGDSKQGKCSFLPAHLLALPIRSDKVPFVLGTSKSIVDSYIQLRRDFGQEVDLIDLKNDHILKISDNISDADLGQTGKRTSGTLDVEVTKRLKSLLSTEHPIVVLGDQTMIELCNDLNLPVIARNSLEDGQSKNLWYEQVLPRESIMFFPIIWDSLTLKEKFDLTAGTLQVGGSASVGYGFTKITEMI